MNLNLIYSEMEQKVVDSLVRYIHKKMPSDSNSKPKKSPTEKSTNKFKEYFGSHHDLRKLGFHKRNVPLTDYRL